MHPDLCCSVLSLCIIFYVFVVTVVATPDLVYFGATLKASRKKYKFNLNGQNKTL